MAALRISGGNDDSGRFKLFDLANMARDQELGLHRLLHRIGISARSALVVAVATGACSQRAGFLYQVSLAARIGIQNLKIMSDN